MKKRSIIYVVLMIISFVFTYLFIYDGINTRVKIVTNYQEKSDVNYEVSLLDNDIYLEDSLEKNKNYIASLVDKIKVNFEYEILFDKYLNGSYSYSVDSLIIAYEDNVEDSLWEKEYTELKDKIKVINQNEIKKINIDDTIEIDYQKYREVIDKFKEDYKIDVSGYLKVNIRIHMIVNFNGLSEQVKDDKVITLLIPLSYDTFKIKVINDYNKIDNYTEFTKKSDVNYLLLIMGAFCFSIGMTLLIIIINELIEISRKESRYSKELKHILKDYGDILVKVDKIFNKQKYNLIYVSSFDELMDVYRKVNTPIAYKEIERSRETIFLIIEEENAWIYRLIVNNLENNRSV